MARIIDSRKRALYTYIHAILNKRRRLTEVSTINNLFKRLQHGIHANGWR